jgi:polysaccharide biosynthesis protein PelA
MGRKLAGLSTYHISCQLLAGCLCFFFFAFSSEASKQEPIKRTILTLRQGTDDDHIVRHPLHSRYEMPLNHLGLKVIHHDLRNGLPNLKLYPDLLGIIIYTAFDQLKDTPKIIQLANYAMDNNIKIVLIGFGFVVENTRKSKININGMLKRLGLRYDGGWQKETYDIKYSYGDKSIVTFERELEGGIGGFTKIIPIESGLTKTLIGSFASDGNKSKDYALIVSNQNGGYISEGYDIYMRKESAVGLWRLNPFDYFRQVFGTDTIPKPDTTTLVGRRIYYSHIDGDGWRSQSRVPKYRNKVTSCAQVVLQEIVKGFPDLPLTVAPIAGDLDMRWFGTKESIDVARKIFKFPHIQAGSHGYSHILNWEYYDSANPAKKERAEFSNSFGQVEFDHERKDKKNKLAGKYALPRSYMVDNFDMDKEIRGSMDFIQRLCPKGKEVKTFQWTGDCIPFKGPIERIRKNNAVNINGGDTRYDQEFPSYSMVMPIGRNVDGEIQIYSSNSNENTYTDSWSKRYFGFKLLEHTFFNTDVPIRIKPMNVYYHMYSAERVSSLRALLGVLNYAKFREITPITTRRYAQIAHGFYTSNIVKVAENAWEINDRGALNTIRFDHATLRSVDFLQSQGVIGERHHQGSLYVALDELYEKPLIVLKEAPVLLEHKLAQRPYLSSSRWRIKDLQINQNYFQLIAKGFGEGAMLWKVSKPGQYNVYVGKAPSKKVQSVIVGDDGLLRLSINHDAIKPVQIKIVREEA